MSTDQNENKKQIFHLTSGQKGLWLLHQIDPLDQLSSRYDWQNQLNLTNRLFWLIF